MSAELPVTKRTRVVRLKERGSYDRETMNQILDEGVICHVAFSIDGQPFVLPMAYAHWNNKLLLHGSIASRLQRQLAEGVEACVCVTHLDSLVLARSVFHHSMNYRSLIAFGRAKVIQSRAEKRAALEILVEHLVPGRSHDAREPSEQELEATQVLEFPLDEASVKMRSGPPEDLARDLDLPVWAGEIPAASGWSAPVAAPDLDARIEPPEYVKRYRRPSDR